MAVSTKAYPRSTVRKIVKAHSQKLVSKDVDVLIYLNYVLFLQSLMKEASINAKQSGERTIGAKNIKKVTALSLMKFKG